MYLQQRSYFVLITIVSMYGISNTSHQIRYKVYIDYNCNQHEVASLLYIKLPIWLSTFSSFPDKLYNNVLTYIIIYLVELSPKIILWQAHQ